MSEYVVLARKYRPQKLDDLVGQSAISQTLKNAISLNRMPHAMLLTGTRGVGKTTTARIVAKALNCEKGPTQDPCGVCSNCIEIATGRNVDVFEIDGASNTSVDDIRTLKENVQYAPSKSRYKIYIIDEVHMLSTSAFNALLKTLEEPPAGVYFIFATTEVHKIPETILSRCQRFDFRQITEEQIASHLRTIMNQEKIQITDQGLSMIARVGNGSLRDALSLLDQVIAFSGESITDEDVVLSLGLTDRTLLSQTIEAFCTSNQEQALQALSLVFEKGFDPKTYLLEVWEKLRAMVILKTCGDVKWLTLPDDEKLRLQKYAQDASIQELERWFDLLKNVISSLSRVEFPRYVIEVAFIRITRPTQKIPFDEILGKIEQLEKKLSQGATFQSSKAIVTQSSTVKQNHDVQAGPNLPGLFQKLGEQKPQWRPVIAAITDSVWANSKIELTFSREFMFEKAKDPIFESTVKSIASEMTGQSVTLKVSLNASEEPQRPVAKKPSLKPTEEAPVIQKAISLFDVKGTDIQVVEDHEDGA
ncbi:MAG: DNA polymerase III subunit gamma/tau [Bdellovibrionales bacterium]|nr:DNA polymerase III subunit gamma/tau [Bdellovibrionales bacterium]